MILNWKILRIIRIYYLESSYKYKIFYIKTNSKMVDLNPSISIVTLNVHGLNATKMYGEEQEKDTDS